MLETVDSKTPFERLSLSDKVSACGVNMDGRTKPASLSKFYSQSKHSWKCHQRSVEVSVVNFVIIVMSFLDLFIYPAGLSTVAPGRADCGSVLCSLNRCLDSQLVAGGRGASSELLQLRYASKRSRNYPGCLSQQSYQIIIFELLTVDMLRRNVGMKWRVWGFGFKVGQGKTVSIGELSTFVDYPRDSTDEEILEWTNPEEDLHVNH